MGIMVKYVITGKLLSTEISYCNIHPCQVNIRMIWYWKYCFRFFDELHSDINNFDSFTFYFSLKKLFFKPFKINFIILISRNTTFYNLYFEVSNCKCFPMWSPTNLFYEDILFSFCHPMSRIKVSRQRHPLYNVEFFVLLYFIFNWSLRSVPSEKAVSTYKRMLNVKFETLATVKNG